MKKKTNTSAKQEQIQSQVKADLFGRLRHLPATYLGKIIAAEGGGYLASGQAGPTTAVSQNILKVACM